MWSLLLQLNPFSKNTFIICMVTVNVLAIAYILISRDQVKKAQAMYEHPAVIQTTKFQRIAGPVRVVEHIIEKPGGERVIERTIDRAPVVTTKDSDKESIPVAPAVASSARYLAGLSWQASLSNPENATAWAGYSFGRLDLLGGVGLKQGDISAHLMVVTRWGK